MPFRGDRYLKGVEVRRSYIPFIFLLMVEGLSASLKKVVLVRVLEGFKVGSGGLEVTHLQYANDTLSVRFSSIENLLTIEEVLISFEFASGLKVNFSKSRLFGFNVGRSFSSWLKATCTLRWVFCLSSI